MHRKVTSLYAIGVPVLFLTILTTVRVEPARSETLKHTARLSTDAVRVEHVGDVSRVSVDGYERLTEAGHPALPYEVISILLPQGEAVASYGFDPGPSHVVSTGKPLEMAEQLVSEDGKPGKGMAMVTESTDNTYPDAVGRYLGTGYLHGRAIASFALFPVRVSGAELRVIEQIDVTVETVPRGAGEEVVVRERFRTGFQERVDRQLSGLVVNPSMTTRYQFDEVRVSEQRHGFQPTSYPSLEGSPVDYVIVTTDALAGIYQQFADWKTAKGVPTVVRTLEWIVANTRNGVDVQETIRFFVRDAYTKWGITYLLLGGDTDILPPRYAFTRFYSGADEVLVDMYFTCLDGSWNKNHDNRWGEGFYVIEYDAPDLYAEVYNGRISLSDPIDVQAVLDKIVSYETAEFPDYMDRFLFLSEVLFPVDWTSGGTISLNGADFAEFIIGIALTGGTMDIVKMYETYTLYANAVAESRQNAIDSLNVGFNHVNHVGHGYRFNMSVGDASIVTNDAFGLTNNGRWGNFYKLNCTSCAYDFPCLAEFFLKNPNGGAVSVIGANESAFPTASSPYMTEYYQLLFDQDVVHIGEAFARSRLPKTPIAEAGDNIDQWTHYIYTLLGDPEMSLFTGAVDVLDINVPASVSLGSNSILVNVAVGGLPVDSATVCLSKDDDDYQVGTTNSIGDVIIDFTAESAGSISVVVTGLNIARHKSTIEVTTSPGAYVNFAGATVDEDSIAGSSSASSAQSPSHTPTPAGNRTVRLVPTYASPPYSTGFESGVLDQYWTKTWSSNGRVQITTANGPHSGSYHMTMDAVDRNAGKATNEAWLHLDLTGGGDITLDFWWKHFGDKTHTQDGVFFSDNGGSSFTKVLDLPGESFPEGSWNNLIVDVDEAASLAGLSINGTFVVKFQQFDGRPIPKRGMAFDDIIVNSTGGSFGNGDGIIDAGETVDFTLDLTNTGSMASDSVWVIVRSTMGGVSVLDSIAEFGVIGSGGTESALDPVRVHFDAAMVDETAVEFTLEIHDTSPAMWEDSFKKEVHAPELVLTTLRIDDSLGNGDGIINPNEPFLLFYELKNYGTGAAYGLEASLRDLEMQFTFVDSMDTYPDITPFVAAENVSGFHIVEQDTISENDLEITIRDLYGRTIVDTIELRGPDAPLVLAFDSSLGADRLQVIWPPSLDPGATYFNVYRSNTSGPPYEKANKDLLEHAVFVDMGLEPSSRYFYVATSIDESGNESPYSLEFDATTNPAQLIGFPLYVEAPTTSSPAVGDINGDGDLEIVIGGDFIYAWHHDGLELRDGDGNAQTWGILNTLGSFFTSAITLADIDTIPGLEIIASDLNTPAVYIMDYNGNPLPGWPQMGISDFRAAPTVGDIDGDMSPEIIAVDHKGRIYVWNVNGTEYRDGDSNPGTQGVFYVTPNTSFHFQTASVCDIDNDGRDEILLPTRSNNLYVLNEDGTSVPGFPFVMNGEAGGSVVTGDIDNDGLPEILVHSKGSGIYLLNHDGSMVPGWPRFAALNNFFAPSPALADFDGDGTLEIVVVGHTLSASKIYVIDWQGNNLPGWPIVYANGFYSESSPVIADIDGDGSMDIVLGDESKFIRAWNINAQPLAGFPIATGDAVRATPFITDIDGDGDLDMIAASWDQYVYVYDMQTPFQPDLAQWPTIQADVQRTGKFKGNVATAVGGALFSFTLAGDVVDLVWTMDAGDDAFDLLRSGIENRVQGVFQTVATKLTVNGRGMLEYRDGSVEMGGTYVYRLVSRSNPEEVFTTQSIYVPISRADLAQNYPNPFNPTTKITFFVPEGGARLVNLVIYDVRGSRVRTLVDEARTVGKYVEVWNGRNDDGYSVSSGVYFYRLTQPGYTATKKMILLK